LGAALRDVAPDAVLLNGYGSACHRAAWRAAWRLGRPILFRGETTDGAVDRGWLKASVRRAALRSVYRRCARLLYIGEASRAHYRAAGVPEARLVFSPYCVDEAPFDAGEAGRDRLRAPARADLGLAGDRLALLFSGKLSERKGVDDLIAAALELPRPLRDRIVLLFLGDGARRAALERAAAGGGLAARFLGFQNQSQLSPFYHAADLLVLPSRSGETWGLVVNEALHHGLPSVVSSRVGCAPDLVTRGGTGEHARAGDPADLARAIERAIALVGRGDVRAACRERVSRYSVLEAARGLAAAYRDVTQLGSPVARRAG
jgi:glycosyltransferase involved in cell wall biosynthesis